MNGLQLLSWTPNISRSCWRYKLGGTILHGVHDSLTGIWVRSILVASYAGLASQVRAPRRLAGLRGLAPSHVAPVPAHSSPRRAAYVSPNSLVLHQIAHGGWYGRGLLHR